MALYNAINVSFPIKFSGKRQGKKVCMVTGVSFLEFIFFFFLHLHVLSVTGLRNNGKLLPVNFGSYARA